MPDLFRPVAKQKIAGKIGQLALEEKATSITREFLIRGYIIATPKRDHKFLRKKLAELNIDVTPYNKYFELSQDRVKINIIKRLFQFIGAAHFILSRFFVIF